MKYKKIFFSMEETIIEYGSRNKSREEIKNNLNVFKKFSGRILSDNDYYKILVLVIFYSGFKAETVTKKKDIILKYFPSIDTVSKYTDNDIAEILNDNQMIKNKRKISSCVENAIKFESILSEYQSFQEYIKSFKAEESFENLMLLKEELEANFKYLGGITVYHFLTDIGLPVLKPDRVICRIFKRLGLIENDKQLLKTVIHGRKFADAVALPIRYIDIILVAYGQLSSEAFGLDKGICLEKNPRCGDCKILEFCNFPQKNT